MILCTYDIFTDCCRCYLSFTWTIFNRPLNSAFHSLTVENEGADCIKTFNDFLLTINRSEKKIYIAKIQFIHFYVYNFPTFLSLIKRSNLSQNKNFFDNISIFVLCQEFFTSIFECFIRVQSRISDSGDFSHGYLNLRKTPN